MTKSQRSLGQAHEQESWWKVMCLTGVDYFSSLGYAPGIAYLAAGLLSPVATVILVLLTVFGALPIYKKVASMSPYGQGSILMLERFLPKWKGKLLVLCLLGFAATDFIITITLSAADAATHLAQNPWIAHNPFAPFWLHDKMLLTLLMLTVLGGIFLKGFREAIGVAVVLVLAYLSLNLVVLGYSIFQICSHWSIVRDWSSALFVQHGSVWHMIALSCWVFPKLALGMSGFETGVAVMPLVKGDPDDDGKFPQGRIKRTKWLLSTAAIIMSIFLIGSSIATTLLIPPKALMSGGEADGRALAYLAHNYVGDYFGTAYDISTVLILWFAGASAMAGLLNLVPRYLPRYGMAPEWARARKPLVTFFVIVALSVTVVFNADVDAQGAAYATGVLVVMTSAAFASTLSVWKGNFSRRLTFLLITLIFCYTTVVNSIERPDGIKIASFFILVILFVSFISRAMRSTELRVDRIKLDQAAQQFIEDASKVGPIRLVANRPGNFDYAHKAEEAKATHNIVEEEIIFLEVTIGDASDFHDDLLEVRGECISGYRVLRCKSNAVPNALAALLLFVRDMTNQIPNIYFGWTEGNPIGYILKYLFLGEGESAPVTREILRQFEHDPSRRPKVHVG
jgi:hypothetical protein